MDKIVLRQEDLAKLVAYIHSRGFHDPSVVVEILDHFACKVEERMNAAPHLSLEAAMEKAHSDFGTMGFRPLVAAYEIQARKKYKAVYRAELKRTLHNVPLVLVALLAGAAVCKGFVWAETNLYHHFLGVNDIVWLLITCVLAAGAWMLRSVYNRAFFESVPGMASRSEYNWMLGLCIGFIVPARELHHIWQVNLFALLYALATTWCIINFPARYHTVKKALDEFKKMEQAVG
jgi:hypothetical protein